MASKTVGSVPQKVRLLGEDLIVFRDGEGRPGLLYPHCMHRGTSLFYGKVEADGIRCCYHGWKFDVEGHCLEQPCEPGGGLNRAAFRQPWYPVRDHYGLVWAYMGPPDKMPLIPRFDHMEPLEEGEQYFVLDNSFQSHADLNGPAVVPYSWLNINDNCMDPYHVYILHSNFSVSHFSNIFGVMPSVTWKEIDMGVLYNAVRKLPDGREMKRVLTWVAPNMMVNPGMSEGPGGSLSIFTAVDDNHMRSFGVHKAKEGFQVSRGNTSVDHETLDGDDARRASGGSQRLRSSGDARARGPSEPLGRTSRTLRYRDRHSKARASPRDREGRAGPGPPERRVHTGAGDPPRSIGELLHRGRRYLDKPPSHGGEL